MEQKQEQKSGKTEILAEEALKPSREAAKRVEETVSGRDLRYHIESYGCQMNAHDSERIAVLLSQCGYAKAENRQEADLILYNTCCVREHAELRVFGNIGALKEQKEQHPGLLIAVCGCMMQQEEVARRLYRRFPYVDMIFGTHELHRLPIFLEKALAGERVMSLADGMEIPEGLPVLREGGFSTCVNIMYGCNNFCTYCIVPYVRGRERSRGVKQVLQEVQELARAGYREVTLLGQNVNSYAGDTDFAGLLRILDKEGGIPRLRFMTSHPKDLSEALIEAMATLPSVCSHIHLPVQSGSSRILSAMNRRYTREQYLDLIKKLRASVRDIEITTDIIVGFPGETEEDFADTLSLVREAGFAAAYTFKYSPRPGTKAARMAEQVPEDVKKRRLVALNALETEVLQRGNEKYAGRSGEVLVEGCDHRETPMLFGKLPNFKMVYFPGDPALIGTLQQVRITNTKTNSLIGEKI